MKRFQFSLMTLCTVPLLIGLFVTCFIKMVKLADIDEIHGWSGANLSHLREALNDHSTLRGVIDLHGKRIELNDAMTDEALDVYRYILGRDDLTPSIPTVGPPANAIVFSFYSKGCIYADEKSIWHLKYYDSQGILNHAFWNSKTVDSETKRRLTALLGKLTSRE